MVGKKKTLSLKELKALRKPIQNLNREWKDKLSGSQKLALWFTGHVGSMGFFIFILCFNLAWMGWNVIAPEHLAFDSAWEFLILLFINNILQILFLPLVMVAQNLQNRHTEVRVEREYDLTLKSEREIEVVLTYLEENNTLLRNIEESLKEKDASIILTTSQGEEISEPLSDYSK